MGGGRRHDPAKKKPRQTHRSSFPRIADGRRGRRRRCRPRHSGEGPGGMRGSSFAPSWFLSGSAERWALRYCSRASFRSRIRSRPETSTGSSGRTSSTCTRSWGKGAPGRTIFIRFDRPRHRRLYPHPQTATTSLRIASPDSGSEGLFHHQICLDSQFIAQLSFEPD